LHIHALALGWQEGARKFPLNPPYGEDLMSEEVSQRAGAVVATPAPAPISAEVWAEGALSVRRVAEMLDCSQRQIFNYMTRGQLRWGRLGRERRIPKIDVMRLLAGD
jgi:excisionase family DNA binding protein